VAVVHGQLNRPVRFTIDVALSADEANKPKQQVDESDGKPSQTVVDVIPNSSSVYHQRLKLFPSLPEGLEHTLVLLQPLTGR
jgi:23S rRNA-/tRNA-specific pseudouridylate synthase